LYFLSRFATVTHDVQSPLDLRLRNKAQGMGRTAVVFAACVLLANGLIGERGLTQTMRARRASAQAAREIVRLQRQNARLRETVRRLRDDPSAIESAARSDLGLVRPGEIVVTIRDLKP
jgi:cell division protein FtsB